MKKKLYWPAIILFLCFSCKKDHSVVVPPSGKKYTVNFSVSNPSAALSAVSNKAGGNMSDGERKFHSQSRTAADTLKKYVKTLTYLVYDNSGNFKRKFYQDSTNTNFGNISDSFDPGTYTVFFIGNAIDQPNITLSSSFFYFYPPQKPDIFYQKFSLTVTNSDVNQAITLTRISSQVQIKATKAVPQNIDSIRVTYSQDSRTFDLSSALAFNYTSSFNYTFSLDHVFTSVEKGSMNFRFSTLFYNTATPFTVTITRYPTSIYPFPVVINNVTCKPNQVTVLTGDVFQILSIANGFQISFDPAWNTQTINF